MSEEKIISNPIKVIRAKCLDCVCGSFTEVKLCPCTDCSLWPFRFGKNPFYNKASTDDEREAIIEQMKLDLKKWTAEYEKKSACSED